jgi:hypothetical protein
MSVDFFADGIAPSSQEALHDLFDGPIPQGACAGDSPAMSTEALLRARHICLSMPESTEQEAWGAPTFRVRKRMFAMFLSDHHGDGRIALWLPAPLGSQGYLVDSDPELYFVPPYVGVKGWIGVMVERCGDEELRSLVVQAYCMVAPRKLQAGLE